MNRKLVLSWRRFDFANSRHSAVNAAVAFQVFSIRTITGFGLGTVQAGARAFLTQFIPQSKEVEYSGGYSLVSKSSTILGPLVFSKASAALGNHRPAILPITLFFIAVMLLLHRVNGGGPNVRGRIVRPLRSVP